MTSSMIAGERAFRSEMRVIREVIQKRQRSLDRWTVISSDLTLHQKLEWLHTNTSGTTPYIKHEGTRAYDNINQLEFVPILRRSPPTTTQRRLVFLVILHSEQLTMPAISFGDLGRVVTHVICPDVLARTLSETGFRNLTRLDALPSECFHHSTPSILFLLSSYIFDGEHEEEEE